MKFHPVDRPFDLESGALAAWESETRRWAILISPTVMRSNRVNVWPRAEDPHGYIRTYCCGPGAAFTISVANALMRALERLPECATARQVTLLLPVHSRDEDGRELRPIATDPVLFDRLMELAGIHREMTALVWQVCVDGLPTDYELPRTVAQARAAR